MLFWRLATSETYLANVVVFQSCIHFRFCSSFHHLYFRYNMLLQFLWWIIITLPWVLRVYALSATKYTTNVKLPPWKSRSKIINIWQDRILKIGRTYIIVCAPPRMVREFAAVHNTTQIRKLLTVLSREFAMSKNANYKKGGLIGLAAMAIALGKVRSQKIHVFPRIIESRNLYKYHFVGYFGICWRSYDSDPDKF